MITQAVAEEELLKASEVGDLKKVIDLISTGVASPTCKARNFPKQQPIHNAAGEGHLEIVKYLIEKQNVDVDAIDKDGWSALFCACDAGQLDVVNYLIDRGAEVNLKDEAGDVPLHRAGGGGYLSCVQALIRNGSTVDIRNNENKNPEDCSSEYPEVVKYFQGQKNLKAEISTMSVKDFENLKDLKKELRELQAQILKYQEKEKKWDQLGENKEIVNTTQLKKIKLEYEQRITKEKENLKHDFVKVMGDEVKLRKKCESDLEAKKNEMLSLKEIIKKLENKEEEGNIDSKVFFATEEKNDELQKRNEELVKKIEKMEHEMKKLKDDAKEVEKLRDDLKDQEQIEKLLEKKTDELKERIDGLKKIIKKKDKEFDALKQSMEQDGEKED